MTTNGSGGTTEEYNAAAEILGDLRKSGLADSTIQAMKIRPATLSDMPALATLRAQGYVIPYFLPIEDTNRYELLTLENTPYSRIKVQYLADPKPGDKRPKYLQGPNTGTHLYFPPIVDSRIWWDPATPLWFTEGEKKAACATQLGFPCIALGGVDSWRSRKVRIGSDSLKSVTAQTAVIALDELTEAKWESAVADELLWLPLENRKIYVCFDSDVQPSKRKSVQRAIFDFCIWLESQGAEAYQVILPEMQGGKSGLDDYIVSRGAKAHRDLNILQKRAKFPLRPNMKGWVTKKLGGKRSRDVYSSVARAMVAHLDHNGVRYKDPLGVYYYFNHHTDVLYALPRDASPLTTLAQTAPDFHHQLVRDYGISAADKELLIRFTDQFQAYQPIQEIAQVYRQSYASKDAIYYQLTDSTLAKVTADDVELARNGTDGVLFQAGCVPTKLLDEHVIPKLSWIEVLKETSLMPMEGMSIEDTRVLVGTLFYLSPWLRRWRGLMLPAEMAISEAGSGKTSLFQLRHGIFTGVLALRNQPEDMRSWYASIADARGMWIADNIGGKIEARLSNEIARIITDPDPAFELRQLYTTSALARVPVDCTFAFTGIYNPFHKPDILQRSVVIRFASIKQKDGSWLKRHYEDIGRDAWVSHHLYVLRDFLRAAKASQWGVSTAHRLTGFEQSLRTMGRVHGVGGAIERCLAVLPRTTQERIAEAEPVIEALRAFSYYRIRHKQSSRVTAADMLVWLTNPEVYTKFGDLRIFKNSRLLDKYIAAHSADVESIAGLKMAGEQSGTRIYVVVPPLNFGSDNGNSG